jgi:hypothetical protein
MLKVDNADVADCPLLLVHYLSYPRYYLVTKVLQVEYVQNMTERKKSILFVISRTQLPTL